MVPVPAEYTPDFWNLVSPESTDVALTCLLPNGIGFMLKVNYNATVAEIKEDVWDEASKYPLYGKLQADKSQYIFRIVNSMAEREELTDECRKLSDIKPMGCVIIISERRQTSADHSINVTIGHLIGKVLQEFDALNSSEINDFRFNMRKMGESIAKERNRGTWQEKLLYQFPPRMSESTLLICMQDVDSIRVETKCEYDSLDPDQFGSQDILQSSFQFNISPLTRPTELIERVLTKKAQWLKISKGRVLEYVLKVCGRDEYLLGDYPLNQYQYIQDCITEHVTPSFLTLHINRIPSVVASDYEYLDTSYMRKSTVSSTNTLRKKKTTQSWSITDNYSITINTASKLNCDIKKTTEIGIQMGLFHGGKPLCQPVKTDEVPLNDGCTVDFDVTLDFDIQVCNVPRNAKLCFVVYEVNKCYKGTKPRKPKDQKSDSQINPIAWANTSVYDYKGHLRTGAMTLYMWTDAEDMNSDEVLHPLGTVVSNPNTEYCTALTLVFTNFATPDTTIVFPSTDAMVRYAESLEKDQILDEITPEVSDNCKRLLSDMENFYDVHDQDRKSLWKYRRDWMIEIPEVFPKLLLCVDWDKKEEVSQAMQMLQEWPKLPVQKSLELLDYAYADQEVRRFAVKCLKDVSDEDLLLYLLQLVQAIKHELYLECDLVTFLIERALRNQKIGHFLFWHLRSEMKMPAISVRFGLILEAYCRGSQEHIPMLQRQIQTVEKLKQCCELVKKKKDKLGAKAAMQEFLNMGDDRDIVRNPLDPSYRCNKIKIEKCRVMDSKMKPLWVVYENSDTYGDDIYIIFKNGDDLRQDMLTLQMIKIMDRLWKKEGLDLRMNPYNCISLEQRVGMIQVVLNAETIANIQKEKSPAVVSSFKKDSILAWLKEYNRTEKALSKAIKEFTLSCAGYCVATYVLGIADRHSDNIMIKRTGQLFHIDFGHILGHFKEKFGIKRERVPFVLTHDFVYVINKGQKGRPGRDKDQSNKALEFMIFQECCEKAFMILRKHGNLILSLFAMMISTGLPELSSEKDLQYLRETLVLNKTDEEALEHFRAKFNEALRNSWSTSVNWASHNISKNNKA
ncbi:phosphatidylinositol 4,5-bisphosphate 3-kinase catalytic subunit delta isoform [Anthonomus grandis grandis]|uniref:phosphatidylinositol 4,5-bisphosphate 3-kinase catalytic subunit delta isoform n=1 Tax=Anthonomus grandis grandis TaxID=2921223 RepID=UPI002165CBB9|nr:phosphatidylinositol 4,5-bisphosphate 3-kinase catalytic subunit delta isoform [Anthonomus grandis grandis]